ncbi:MAG TPA: hypothetical protein VL944_01755 [Candidatus Acidoferrum sp.]|nr:hypothetical protein [Candidatus Acidoferrum sp.]
MVQMESTGSLTLDSMLTRREQLVMLEIGLDSIGSASSFVEYMSDSYRISKSSIWYILKRLKDKGILEFATKDDPGRSLELTRGGKEKLHLVEHSKTDILAYFTGAAMQQTIGMHRMGLNYRI